jgi:hypothetical protein
VLNKSRLNRSRLNRNAFRASSVVIPPTPAVSQVPSDLRTPFLAFRSILVNEGVFREQSCIVTLEDEIPENADSPFCMISPEDFSTDTATSRGAGRFGTQLRGTFNIKIMVRNLSDIASTDYNLVTSPNTSLGMLALTWKVIDKLHLCFPIDESGNLLFAEPPSLRGFGKAKRTESAPDWGGIEIAFDAVIELNLPSAV